MHCRTLSHSGAKRERLRNGWSWHEVGQQWWREEQQQQRLQQRLLRLPGPAERQSWASPGASGGKLATEAQLKSLVFCSKRLAIQQFSSAETGALIELRWGTFCRSVSVIWWHCAKNIACPYSPKIILWRFLPSRPTQLCWQLHWKNFCRAASPEGFSSNCPVSGGMWNDKTQFSIKIKNCPGCDCANQVSATNAVALK